MRSALIDSKCILRSGSCIQDVMGNCVNRHHLLYISYNLLRACGGWKRKNYKNKQKKKKFAPANTVAINMWNPFLKKWNCFLYNDDASLVICRHCCLSARGLNHLLLYYSSAFVNNLIYMPTGRLPIYAWVRYKSGEQVPLVHWRWWWSIRFSDYSMGALTCSFNLPTNSSELS